MSQKTSLVKYFESQEITFIEKDNELWLTAEQIGNALGYSDPRARIHNLVDRNADEFEGLTAVVNLTAPEELLGMGLTLIN